MLKQIKTGLIPCFYLFFTHTLQGQTTYFSRQFDTLSMVETAYNSYNEPYGFSTVFSGFSTTAVPKSSICYRKLDFEGNDLPGQFCIIFDSLSFERLWSEKNEAGIWTICGRMNEYGTSHSSVGIGLFRINTSGELLSEFRYFNDTVTYFPAYFISKPNHTVICGQAESNGNGDMFLMKIDSIGNILLKKTYGGAYYEGCYSATQTPDNGFLLLGWTRSFGNGQRDFYLVKTDSLGNQEWQKTYGTSANEGGWGIIALSDGNYLMGGGGGNPGGNGWAELIKISPSGTVLYKKKYTYPGDIASSINWPKELPDGNIVAVGLTGSDNAGYLLKTDSEGNEIWQQKYNFSSHPDLFKNVTLTTDGGYLLSGFCVNQASNNTSDAWLLKVDSLGCPYPNCTVGIEEASKVVAFNLWPNPATDELRIENYESGMKSGQLSIKNSLGQVVYNAALTQGVNSIDTAALAQGIYLCSIVNSDVKFKTQKLVIIR